ncbi:MAG: glycosyltransferase family 4 protein, partial [Oscillospiraceae bacterium]|nr:glycosyltransferase family 4 protein [Oscillospiraceae bacterium]
RILALGAQEAGIPLSLQPLRSREGATVAIEDLAPLCSGENAMRANLFVFNADCSGAFLHQCGAAVLRGRYNIAHWSWELPEFPKRWDAAFAPYDEIWTISEFCRDAIAARTGKSVRVIPYGIRPNPDRTLTRADFGLPEDRLLYLCMCDLRSTAQRKHPLGALDAYCRAFPEENGETALVIKLIGGSVPQSVRTRMAGRSDILLLEGSYERSRADALLSLCDVFISLHRSEGFGLPIAEAMVLGKAVVATGWSGNMDFCSSDNACCVRYTLTEIGRLAVAPYDAWQRWAEPDIDDAAGYLRRLRSEPDWRRSLAAAGQETILSRYSPRCCGEAIRSRLAQLELL